VAPLPTPAANESRTGDHAPVLKEYVLTAGARNLRCRYPPRSSALAHSAAMGGAASLTPMAWHRTNFLLVTAAHVWAQYLTREMFQAFSNADVVASCASAPLLRAHLNPMHQNRT
jgi:hypothetical protein